MLTFSSKLGGAALPDPTGDGANWQPYETAVSPPPDPAKRPSPPAVQPYQAQPTDNPGGGAAAWQPYE